MKPTAFLTRTLPPSVMERLERETDLAVHAENRPATNDEIIAGLAGRDALLCTVTDRIDAALLDACPSLKVIANFGVGYNHIDVGAATERKIAVTNTPGVLTDATADLSFALLLAAARRLGEGERIVRARQWKGWGPLEMLGAELNGATLGIVGFGRIGRAVARRALGFGMRVIYWNRTRLSSADETACDANYAPLDELLRTADFISVHVAYTPETHHLIGDAQLALLKPTAYLINTARGAIIDERALVRALQSRRLAGAGLDVFEHEPQIEPELFTFENVVLIPHLGSATIATRTRMGMIAVDNLRAVCAGERPPNCVNPEALEGNSKDQAPNSK